MGRDGRKDPATDSVEIGPKVVYPLHIHRFGPDRWEAWEWGFGGAIGKGATQDEALDDFKRQREEKTEQ